MSCNLIKWATIWLDQTLFEGVLPSLNILNYVNFKEIYVQQEPKPMVRRRLTQKHWIVYYDTLVTHCLCFTVPGRDWRVFWESSTTMTNYQLTKLMAYMPANCLVQCSSCIVSLLEPVHWKQLSAAEMRLMRADQNSKVASKNALSWSIADYWVLIIYMYIFI